MEDTNTQEGAPRLVVTQHDEHELQVIPERNNVGINAVQLSALLSEPPIVMQPDISGSPSTARGNRHSLTPLSTITRPVNSVADYHDRPGLLSRSQSLVQPSLANDPTTRHARNFGRNPKTDTNASPEDRSRLKIELHVPYEPQDANLDLVLIYMFHGGKEEARSFFECPETPNEPQERQGAALAKPDHTANGDAKPPESRANLKPPEHGQSNPGGSRKTARPKVTNWLRSRHMLPEALPLSRVLCVGYKLSGAPKDERIDFDKASRDLLVIVNRERESDLSRPAILIGHGYGCRVVEEAIRRPDAFWDYCAGAMFHHPPHDDKDPRIAELAVTARPEPSTNHPGSAKFLKPDYAVTASRIVKTMEQHSVLHQFLQHESSAKDQTFGMRFAAASDRNFQLIRSKIVEWCETYHLFHAVKTANFRKLRHLIESGIEISQRKSAQLMTALHVACQAPASRFQHIDFLAQSGKADVVSKDSFGRTPLHYAVERRQPDSEIVRVLLESGAHTDVKDHEGKTPLDLAEPNTKIHGLLLKRPLIEGPSANQSPVPSAQPHSPLASQACNDFQMTATEMYYNSDTLTEKHLPRRFSIQEALYGEQKLQKLLDDTRISGIEEQLVCRWYHLPANNMVWVEDLFRNRFKIHPTVWSEQVRDSEWPHGRCILPHAAQFTAWGDLCKEEIVAICMPYVSYEENHRHSSVSATVHAQAQPDDIRRVFPKRIHRLWTLERQRSHRKYEAAHMLSPPSPTARPRENAFRAEESWSDDHGSSVSPSRKSSPVGSGSDSEDENSNHDRVHAQNGGSRNAERLLVQEYLHHKPPLHARRTLDQYYYYMLKDTRVRDADQVVTRWAIKQLGEPHHNILMVDQLWIWVIVGQGNQPDRVVSCFPDRQGLKSWPLDDLQRNVLNHKPKNREPIATTAGLCSRIISTCSDIFGWSQEAELVRFLHFFEATVGRIGDDEISRLKEFRDWSDDLHRLNERQSDYAKKKDELLDNMLDIRPQIELLEEAKDIRDEINIILSVLGEQRRVLETEAAATFFHSKDSESQCAQPLRIINKAIVDFEKMDKQTKEVQDGLNHLLDLQQKQASVWEARSAREGARATSKQSTVMVIFTMVTIVFLPLSFMASFFALDVAEFPSDDKGQTNWPLRRVCALLFGISLGVIVPLIALAFATKTILSLYRRVRYEWLTPWAIKGLQSAARLPGSAHKKRCNIAIGILKDHLQGYCQGETKRKGLDRLFQQDKENALHASARSHRMGRSREGEQGEQNTHRIPLLERIRQRRSKKTNGESV
ncbi:hypothetical protein Q7P37_011234 [Cladosporium fusiforme]